MLFIIGDWNSKVGSQELLGITSKFALGVQNEAGQSLTEFCQENVLVIANTSPNKTKDVLFIIGDWNAKVESQEIPGVTGKFGLENKMKQGKG